MKTYKLNEISEKRILGRNVKNAGNTKEPLALFWGASALEVCIKAKELWVNFSSEYDCYEAWVAVEVNGRQISRFMAPKESSWICVARNLNPQKANLISIIKDTQPMSGEEHHSLFINGLGLDEEGTFEKLPQRKLKIEFVGDSITSGEGLAGATDEWEWITQWFCASKSYAVQTAKALNADYSVFSQCGWGIKWGWNGDVKSALPPHYENVCSVMWGDYQNKLGVNDKYDFGKGYDFVVVNLGTNDNGAFFQPPFKNDDGTENILHKDEKDLACREDGEKIGKGVYDFLKVIRSKNPSAKIIWVWGMIKLTAIPPYITEAVENYKKESGDKNVYTLELDSMEDVEKTEEDKGSRGHPGPKTHKLAAEKITAFIQKLN